MSTLLKKLRMYDSRTIVSYAFLELKSRLITMPLRHSYSQCGEDAEIDRILGHKDQGFYVDIGASDPRRFNNTNRFYRRGWSGLNIEPNPELFSRLKKARRRDVNLNIGIGEKRSRMVFQEFVPYTLSTFSEAEAARYQKQGYKLVESYPVDLKRLDEVLREHCDDRDIDFMSIDTEGLDLEVLHSNDWETFRPRVICIESVRHGSERASDEQDLECARFLREVGYRKTCDNGLNSIYIECAT